MAVMVIFLHLSVILFTGDEYSRGSRIWLMWFLRSDVFHDILMTRVNLVLH